MRRVLGLVVVLAATGCGGDTGVAVSGRLVEKGTGYVAGGDETFDFRVQPVGGAAAGAYLGVLAADGGFTLTGPAGPGVPPGKYEVVFTSRREGEAKDKYNFRFGPGKTPLRLEVAPAPKEQRFTIDLTASTVTPS